MLATSGVPSSFRIRIVISQSIHFWHAPPQPTLLAGSPRHSLRIWICRNEAAQCGKEHNMRNNFPKYPARRENAIAGSGTPAPAERLQLIRAPVLEGFNSHSSFGVRGSAQSLDTDQLKAGKPAGTPAREVSFGPF